MPFHLDLRILRFLTPNEKQQMNILSSTRALKLESPWFSIITCSYNRSHTLDNCYKAVRELRLPQDEHGNTIVQTQ